MDASTRATTASRCWRGSPSGWTRTCSAARWPRWPPITSSCAPGSGATAAPALLARIDDWTAPERERAAPIPADRPGGRNLVSAADNVSVSLEPGETRLLLQKLPAVYRTQINDVLLTGLGHALAEWTGSRWVQVSLEGHGREELFEGVDLSRTVGWFTTEAPVLLEVAESGDAVASLR